MRCAPLTPASTVTAEDVALRRVPQNLLPEGTFDSTDDVVGHVAVAAISPNEIPSHLRFVGSELASYLVNLDTLVTNQETDSAQEISVLQLWYPLNWPIQHSLTYSTTATP